MRYISDPPPPPPPPPNIRPQYLHPITRRRTYFDKFVSQHLSGAGSSPAGSISRDLNSQKLHY